MTGIIVVFPNKDNATNIRNLLVRSGFDVTGVCTSGAQAVSYADMLDEGIIVCGYKMKDMLYSELREYLPEHFEVLLVASREKWGNGLAEGVVGLSMPIRAHELIDTIQMMMGTIERRRRRRKKLPRNRDAEQDKLIRQAKELLMERNHLTEDEAHRYLQKNSMISGNTMVETAEMVLSIMRE